MEKDTVYGTPSQVTINGEMYNIQSENHIDQIFYHITQGGEELCVLSLNDEGIWESNCDINEDLVRSIGDQIERMEI